ncbi:MAG: ABC transporter ATP-binding protein [Pseudomonadota bacterium]|nr:ABC transporter ATP-binding protein [Pseudomonadota bacterium]
MNKTVLELIDVRRTFKQSAEPLHILRGCSLKIGAGELVALIGPSGSGKSTFLHAAGLLERPDSGSIMIGGQEASRLGDDERTKLRRTSIGFVYQAHHLLQEFSACENIMLPQMVNGVSRSAAEKRARELLDLVGLLPRADHRPARLSGGEQQRVALVRALANNPPLMIADEPTGNLDPQTSAQVFEVLQNLVRTRNLALLMATHNHELARRMSRVVEIKEGLVVEA